MNTARLARRLQEAKGDAVVMAEAIGDEFDDPVHGYVTREMFDARMDALEARIDGRMDSLEGRVNSQLAALRAEIAALRADMNALEARLMRTMVLTQITGFVAIIVAIMFK